jgi:hypothetical protein
LRNTCFLTGSQQTVDDSFNIDLTEVHSNTGFTGCLLMSRKVLRGGNFESKDVLRTAIEAFVKAYGPNAKPFEWRKRDVKGSQLRNTIVNLCN